MACFVYKAKINNLKKVTIWIADTTKSKSLYVNEMVAALILVINMYKKNLLLKYINMFSHINSKNENYLRVNKLVDTIKNVIGLMVEIDLHHKKAIVIFKKYLNNEPINNLYCKLQLNLEKSFIKSNQEFTKI